jgi:hypothetical protein
VEGEEEKEVKQEEEREEMMEEQQYEVHDIDYMYEWMHECMLEKDDKNKQNSIPKIQAVQGRSKDNKTATEKVRRGIEITIAMRRGVADKISPFCVFQCEKDEKQRKKQR